MKLGGGGGELRARACMPGTPHPHARNTTLESTRFFFNLYLHLRFELYNAYADARYIYECMAYIRIAS